MRSQWYICLQISGALTDEEITYNDQVKKVKKGVFINGKVNLFGLAFSLTLEISDKVGENNCSHL